MIYRLSFIIVLLMTMVFPALAQEDDTVYTLAFEGVELQYSADIADSVTVSVYPGDPVDGAGPGFSDAKHVMFELFSRFDADANPYPSRVRVYRIDDLMQYDFMAEKVGEVQWMLDERPDLVEYYDADKPLPFLPILPHGQVLRARASYVDSDVMEGITYITSVQFAAIEPLLSDSLIYVFQGISSDGQYYVSADFALDISVFPETTPEDFNIETFVENFSAYQLESVKALNEADESVFVPALETLEDVVRSLRFE